MKIFEEVNFIDGVQEFIESEYITILLSKNTNVFQLKGAPSQDSIRFSGDVSLFKKLFVLTKKSNISLKPFSLTLIILLIMSSFNPLIMLRGNNI